MELDVNEKESAVISDAELGERVTQYMGASLGKPKQAGEVWNSIADRLGEQDGSASAEFARSLNGFYSGERAAQDSVAAKPKANTPTPLQRNVLNRATRSKIWNPVLAAGVVLAIIGLLATVLALSGGGGDKIPREATPTFIPTPAPNTPTIALESAGIKRVFDGGYKNVRKVNSIRTDSFESSSDQSRSLVTSTMDKSGNVATVQVITAGQRHVSTVPPGGYSKSKDVSRLTSLILQASGTQADSSSQLYARTIDSVSNHAPTGTAYLGVYQTVRGVRADCTVRSTSVEVHKREYLSIDDRPLELTEAQIPTRDISVQFIPSNRDLKNETDHWQ